MAITVPSSPPENTLLELYSGSGNISAAFRRHGWKTITVDNDERCGADICMDILEFQPAVHLPPSTKIHLIWASPPCIMYSTMRRAHGKPSAEQMELADSLVRKAIQVADEIGCPILLENPWSGDLKRRGIPELDRLPMQKVDYCQYGCTFRKRTAVWTDTSWQPVRPLCCYNCHATTIDAKTGRKRHLGDIAVTPPKDRAVIPKSL
jgi:hypothetical protein